MSITYHNKNIVGLIQFIIILDNQAKRLYSKYFLPSENDLSLHKNQLEFEAKLANSVINFNVNTSNEMDIFNLGHFLVVSKVNREIAIFVGALQDENESIVANFFQVLEDGLENATSKRLTRKGVLDCYQKVVLVVDEMVSHGIIINTDGESVQSSCNVKSEEVSAGGYFSSLVGFAKSSLSNAMKK